MNMKKWLISAVTLTLALGTAGAVTAFALTADGGSDNPEVPNGGDTTGDILHGDPTYEEWLSDFGDGKVVTSIDDIDPNVFDYIHNINACTAEELEELGNLAAISWVVDPGTEVEGEPEPPFVDGEPGHQISQPMCALDQGVVVTSEGQASCVDTIVLEDGGQDPIEAQPPKILPTPNKALRSR